MSAIIPPGSPPPQHNANDLDNLNEIAKYAVGLEEVDYDLYADYMGTIDRIFHHRIGQLMHQYRDYDNHS